VPPSLIVSDDKVAQIRAQEAKEKVALLQMVAAQQMAETAKTASDAKTGDKSVLTDMAGAAQ
jgi:hypothetical protein